MNLYACIFVCIWLVRMQYSSTNASSCVKFIKSGFAKQVLRSLQYIKWCPPSMNGKFGHQKGYRQGKMPLKSTMTEILTADDMVSMQSEILLSRFYCTQWLPTLCCLMLWFPPDLRGYPTFFPRCKRQVSVLHREEFHWVAMTI